MSTLSWHQQRAAGWHALPYDVVGYVFRADTYCPACTVAALPTGPGEAFDGWALAPGADPMTPEDNLREIAYAFGIDIDDEATYDSDDFPKVLFRDQASENDDRCGGCGAELT
jgi:hypothetical protein